MTVRYQLWQNNNTNGGIGQFSLPSQAYNSNGTEHTIQVSDTQVISDRTVNQTRFQYLHDSDNQTPQNLQAAVSVLGAFTGGGNSSGKSMDTEDHYELQNYTSISLGKHFVRFGGRLRDVNEFSSSTGNFNGTFTFPSLNAYQTAEQSLQQCTAAGGTGCEASGASQFSIVSGIPHASVNLIDLGLYGEDDLRLRPNMTLSLGLRFETQSGIHDHADIAPRVGLAWGLGRGKSPKTVLRAGFGIFYDRFSQGYLLQAERLNGCNQQNFIFNQPDFFPSIPPLSTVAGCQSGSNIDYVDPNLRTPYTIQGGVGLERQLTKNATVSVTYLNSNGVHQILNRDINAPLPGTYPLGEPSVGQRPYQTFANISDVGNIYQYESVGIFNQNQLITNFNMRMGGKLTLFGVYTLGYADGNGSSPMNPYDIAEDYGRAGFDVRNRVFVGGTWTAPHGFTISPFVVANSGAPFNITLGQDLYGTSVFNGRPALASPGASGSNILATRWGTFNTVPASGDTIIPPNYGTGPGQFTTNLRLSKVFGLGKKLEGPGSSRGSGGGPGMGGGRGGYGGGLGGRGLGGGGGGGMFGSASTNTRYSLTFSANARNIFNNVNLSSPIGVIGSPLFGHSNGLVGGFFSSAAANRRIDLQVAFNF
jgi:hypothetical protein